MDRDSRLYKLRRKLQVVAHYVLPDKWLSNIYSKIVIGKTINFANPQTFNEKIQWMKLHYYPNNPLVIQCADKYAVREYVKNKGYENLLVPLVGAWKRSTDINWEKLPQQFVLKCNHGCGYNIACNDKDKLDKQKTLSQLITWMGEDFGVFNLELHYSKIKPHIITAEEFLGDCIKDFKFFCFGGEPKFFYLSNDLIHDRQAQMGFFDMNGEKIPLIRNDYADIPVADLPSYYDEMVQVAKDLSTGFPFVRVDFFIANGRFYFAELTFTPAAGMMPLNPEKYNLEWGKMIELPK